jgi:Ca2+:H+ antiporter
MNVSTGDRRLIGLSAALTAAAAATRYTASGRVIPFVVSGLALGALAALVGRSVDRLGGRLGSGATGVVQSALGNLPELFFGIFALRQGLVTVVQATLVGSILANVLLVLGLAFVAGGLRHGTQRFSAEAARLVVLLLVLAVAVLVIPTVAARLHGPVAHHEAALSNVAAVVLLAVFALSVPASLRRSAEGEGSVVPEAPTWSLAFVVVVLGASGVAAAAVSDWFVSALTPALGALHISQAFAGLVIVAIAGNAVENVVGIQLAARNRMDYALAVTLQSPVQIALVLVPALVLLSNVVGGVALTLVLPLLLVVTLAIAAVVAMVVVFDGESTWLEGVCMIGLYVVIAAAFWWG